MVRNATIAFIFLVSFCNAQGDWSLALSSSVELRTLKLTNKAEKTSNPLGGATISLYQGSAVIKQIQSDAGGDFTIIVPGNGDYMMVVSYQDCNPKKFEVSTRVPPKFNTDNWKPTFSIEGVIMAKPLYSIDYSALKQPLARIAFMKESKKIDDDEAYTEQILDALKRLKAAEDDLIERFITATKAGDAALKKPDCPLAKARYGEALKLIPGEQYPTEQLLKVGECLQQTANAEKAAVDRKAAEQKAAAAKALQDQQEKLAREKAEKDQEEAIRQKNAQEKLAKEKEVQLAREEAAKKKQEESNQKMLAAEEAKKKEEAEKVSRQNLQEEKDKQEKERIARESDKREKERIAKEKESLEKKQLEEKGKKLAEVEESRKQKRGADAVESAKKKTAAFEEKPKTTQKAPHVKEEVSKSRPFEPESSEGNFRRKKRKSGYSTPQPLIADRYKETIKRADSYFRLKQYAEAKSAYEEALQLKSEDVYAAAKLAEVKELLQSK
jgi:hypothetical protein